MYHALLTSLSIVKPPYLILHTYASGCIGTPLGNYVHKGEHNNTGVCWCDADNPHVGLNKRMEKEWATAIVGFVYITNNAHTNAFQSHRTATINEPPNIKGMETTRDGVPLVRPRGCGARPSLPQSYVSSNTCFRCSNIGCDSRPCTFPFPVLVS